MHSVDSVVDFFYNVVPGIIFLIILDLVYVKPDFPSDSGEKIFLFIVLGLFLGFTSQVVVKFLRAVFCFNSKWIFSPVIKEDKTTFEHVDKLLNDLRLINKNEMGNNLLSKNFI